jgi:prepilin-type N-terminal cleavage/methylation domain-containing protein
MKNKTKKTGFTLVELLVVIAIIGILTMISASSFVSSKTKASDSQRKSDLDSISKTLMMYYNDKGVFPATFPFGNNEVGFTGDNQIVYMRQTPKDPINKGVYTYQYVLGTGSTSFKLFANLENKNDLQCNGGYSVVGIGYTFCYGVSSPNITVGAIGF